MHRTPPSQNQPVQQPGSVPYNSQSPQQQLNPMYQQKPKVRRMPENYSNVNSNQRFNSPSQDDSKPKVVRRINDNQNPQAQQASSNNLSTWL